MKRALPCLLAALALFACAFPSRAGEGSDWATLAVIRFGNIDAIDAEDGELAAFMKSIRNDGRFIPPLHALIGPEIRNNTFFGIAFEGWMEGVVLVPPAPGPVQHVWAFPVDNRDEYMTQLANFGLTEYEGMDGVTRLRELDSDGNPHTWYMEWLPGNVAIFGANREAVAAAKRIYAESVAARGLLHQAGGRYVEPDITLRLEPGRLVAWQDSEYGLYWWRQKIGKLTTDLINYWQPNPARERLINVLADRFTLWPRSIASLEATVWFEREGIEWRLTLRGDAPASRRGQLNTFRQVPERTALAYAVPVSEARFRDWGVQVGELLLGAAGGVVSQEARAAARAVFARLEAAGLQEATACWVSPPSGQPELGGTRLLVAEWRDPASLDAAFTDMMSSLGDGTPAGVAFSQMGFAVRLEPYGDDTGSRVLWLRPSAGGEERTPYYHGGIVARLRGNRLVLAVGEGRQDAGQMRRVMEYRASLAEEVIAYDGPGQGDVRNAFSRMGASGATFLAVFDPVRFLQMCLVEAADWRPRSPDQHEPLSTQLAREMLEYGAGRAWTVCGEAEAGAATFTGGIPWQNLSRLSAALGITESISMDGNGD